MISDRPKLAQEIEAFLSENTVEKGVALEDATSTHVAFTRAFGTLRRLFKDVKTPLLDTVMRDVPKSSSGQDLAAAGAKLAQACVQVVVEIVMHHVPAAIIRVALALHEIAVEKAGCDEANFHAAVVAVSPTLNALVSPACFSSKAALKLFLSLRPRYRLKLLEGALARLREQATRGEFAEVIGVAIKMLEDTTKLVSRCFAEVAAADMFACTPEAVIECWVRRPERRSLEVCECASQLFKSVWLSNTPQRVADRLVICRL